MPAFSFLYAVYFIYMLVSPAIFRIVQMVIVLGVITILGTIGYFLLTTDADVRVSDTVREAEMRRMQATARAYFARLEYFDGVCGVVRDSHDPSVCNESVSGYAISTALKNGSYYCVDSTDFAGMTEMPLGTKTRCNQ